MLEKVSRSNGMKSSNVIYFELKSIKFKLKRLSKKIRKLMNRYFKIVNFKVYFYISIRFFKKVLLREPKLVLVDQPLITPFLSWCRYCSYYEGKERIKSFWVDGFTVWALTFSDKSTWSEKENWTFNRSRFYRKRSWQFDKISLPSLILDRIKMIMTSVMTSFISKSSFFVY